MAYEIAIRLARTLATASGPIILRLSKFMGLEEGPEQHKDSQL